MSEEIEKLDSEGITAEEEQLIEGEISETKRAMQEVAKHILESGEGDTFKARQEFRKILDRDPNPKLLKNHPIVKGHQYLGISHLESMLDTFFFGQWGTRNFTYHQVANEVVGQIELWYIDPITEREITRSGAGAVQIMTDAIPTELLEKMNKQEKNRWRLNHDNKKANALEAGFPKLKSMCFRNACSQIGKTFGRDVSRVIVGQKYELLPETEPITKRLQDEKRTSQEPEQR